MFDSLREYSLGNRQFDLTAANDNLAGIPDPDRQRVKDALLPYANTPMRFAGIAVIDLGTYLETECQVLHTRKSEKAFDVDIVCVEAFPTLATEVYSFLNTELSNIVKRLKS